MKEPLMQTQTQQFLPRLNNNESPAKSQIHDLRVNVDDAFELNFSDFALYDEIKARIKKHLQLFSDVFSKHEFDFGRTEVFEHEIKLLHDIMHDYRYNRHIHHFLSTSGVETNRFWCFTTENDPLDVDDLMLEKEGSYSGLQAYKNSKLANVYFTYELSKLLVGTGVTVNAMCPGE